MKRREWEAVAEGLAAAALCLAPLLLGMVHLPAILLISALGWLALAVLVAAKGREPLRLGWFPWALLAFAFGIGLQLLPLPMEAVRLLSPEAARIFELTLGPDPGPRPLSLDLPATWAALVKALGMAAVAAVLHHRALTTPKGRRRLRIYLVATAAAVILLGLLHFLLQEKQRFLGLYTFRASHHFRTSFGNANHLAGFLSLGGLVALGMALHARALRERLVYLAVFLGAGAGVFLSASRGGFLGFAAGLFLFGAIAWIAKRRGEGASWRSWATLGVATVLITSLAAWIYVEFPRALREVQSLLSVSPETERGKLEAAETAWRAAKAHWLTGIGRGAFESAGTHYQSSPYPRTWFTHAENEPLQALAEFGIPWGALLVGVFALAWLGLLRRGQRSLAEAGVAAGLFALSLQNLVDFSLQGATGLAFAALLAHPASRTFAAPPWLGRTMAALGLVLLAGGSSLALPGLEEENRRLVALEVRGPEELEAQVRRALLRRPADWVPVDRMATYLLFEADDPAAALPWINKEILLYPQGGRGHRLAGEALARLGQDRQARWAFQAAAERGVSTIHDVLAWYDAPEALLQALPAEPREAADAIERLLRQGQVEVAREAANRALGRFPNEPALLRSLYAVEVRRGAYAEALAIARTLREKEPEARASWTREAAALARVGRTEEARALYEEGLRRFDAHASLVFGWARLELDEKRPEVALEVLDRLPLTTDREIRRRYHELRARAFRQQNKLVRTRDELGIALRLSPDSERLQISLADVLGELAEFSEAGKLLDGLDPENPAVQAAHRRLADRRRKYQEERGLDLERLLR